MKPIKHTTWLILPFMVACLRGAPSHDAPIHLQRNMMDQTKFEPFEKNTFFENQSAMRMPVEGTLAKGDLHDDEPELYKGLTAQGSVVKSNPIPMSEKTMMRGQDRFNIYCSPCHGATGNGKGIVAKRGQLLGFIPPTNLISADMISRPDGHFFDVITHGIRNMQGYAYQIPSVQDRWSIVYYIRALQRSQNATLTDLPKEMRVQQ